MFCVNCGNKLEEEWKICPECGTEVIKQKEEQKIEILEKRVCEKCGNELQDDWVKCPFCGYAKNEGNSQQKEEQSGEIKVFEFEGFRRTGRFGFQYIASEIEVDGEEINAVVHKKKECNYSFTKHEISQIKFPILPVIGPMDIFRIVLFLLLMFLSKGLAIFAVLFFFKITLVRHMQITLQNGLNVEIPIRQKAESVDFLREIRYPEITIKSIESSAVSNSRIVVGEWILSTLMLILAAATLYIGMQSVADKMNNRNTEINSQETVVEEEKNIEEDSQQREEIEKEADDSTEQSQQEVIEIPQIIEADYEYLYGGVMDSIISEVSAGGGMVEYLTYAYYDIDKDGYLDFIMENGTSNADARYEVYSTRDGKNIIYLGDVWGAITLYACPERNGFYTDYGHTDYETVTYVYIEGDNLQQEIIHDNIYTTTYGYINGTQIKELQYQMETHTLQEYYQQ